MLILNKIKPSDNQYGVIESWNLDEAPENFYIIPEDLDTSIFYKYRGCVNLILEEDGVTVAGFTPNEEAYNSNEDSMIPILKAAKEKEISSSCNSAILAGMDVETSEGIEHFSLQETDQINLTTALSTIQQGAKSYPYHADGKLCRMFSAEEIVNLVNASIQHKVYHTTLCNHLLTWVRRAQSVDEIDGIIYTKDNLPEDLAENMNNILGI